jgi:glucokinase
MLHSSVNMPALEGLALREQLAGQLKLPVRCANDANLIALGEARFGAGQEFDSLMVVTIGTGLGSGLLLNRRLWVGSNGFAAEFGHVTVEPEGFACPCGNRGCLERYVSATALRRQGGGREASELARLARLGDHDALQLFRQLGRHLGIALAGLLNVLNLDGIVIGGGVSASYDLFQTALEEELRQRTFAQILSGVVVRQAVLGDDAGLLGAAQLAADACAGQGCLHSTEW